jgi:hypothetical protein
VEGFEPASTQECQLSTVLLITSWHRLHRKHCSCVAVGTCLFVVIQKAVVYVYVFSYLEVIPLHWVYTLQNVFRCIVSLTYFLVVNVFLIYKTIFYVQTYLVVGCHLRFSDLV